MAIPAPQSMGKKSSAEMSQKSPKMAQRAPGPSPLQAHIPSTAGTNRAVPTPGLVRTQPSPWGVMRAGATRLLSKSYGTHVGNCRFPGKSTALTNNLPLLGLRPSTPAHGSLTAGTTLSAQGTSKQLPHTIHDGHPGHKGEKCQRPNQSC